MGLHRLSRFVLALLLLPTLAHAIGEGIGSVTQNSAPKCMAPPALDVLGAEMTATPVAGACRLQLDSDLGALAAFSSTGLVARTAAATFLARTITAPAAGITVTTGDGVSGNPTLGLANDLAAAEGLSGTGVVTRTATDTWGTLPAATAQTITMSNTEGGTIYGGDDDGKTLTLKGSNHSTPGPVVVESALSVKGAKTFTLSTDCTNVPPWTCSSLALAEYTHVLFVDGSNAAQWDMHSTTGHSEGRLLFLQNSSAYPMRVLSCGKAPGPTCAAGTFSLGLEHQIVSPSSVMTCMYMSTRWRCGHTDYLPITGRAGAQTLTMSSNSDGTINGGTTSGATLTLSGSTTTPGQVQTASGFSIGTRASLDVTGADPAITSPATVSCTEPGAGCPSSCGVCSITPGPYNHIYVSAATAAFSIDKLVGTDGTVGGRVVVINNSTAQNVTLVHGTAASALRLPSGSNIVLPQYGTGWCVSFASSGSGFFSCK